MPKTPRTIRLIVHVPKGCDADDTAQYCLDAIGRWGGQFHPDDPRFPGLKIKMMASSTYVYNLTEGKHGQECATKTAK